MKKTLALLLTLAMSVSVFAGCAGTAVVEKENTNTEVSTEVAVNTEAVADTEVDGTAASTSEPRPVTKAQPPYGNAGIPISTPAPTCTKSCAGKRPRAVALPLLTRQAAQAFP